MVSICHFSGMEISKSISFWAELRRGKRNNKTNDKNPMARDVDDVC
jgi:hypothetical protein